MTKAFSELEASVKRIQALAERPGIPASLAELAQVAALDLEVARKAAAANDDAAAEAAAARIDKLAHVAAALDAASAGRQAPGWLQPLGMGALGVVFAMLGHFLLAYINGVGYAKLAAVENTRPLLVIAAIISTITFGGALLFGFSGLKVSVVDDKGLQAEKAVELTDAQLKDSSTCPAAPGN